MKIHIGRTIIISAILATTFQSCSTSKGTVNGSSEQPISAIETLAAQNTDATLWFATSAEYYYLAKMTFEFASDKVYDELKKMNPDKTPAVILDLDETVLDNSKYSLKMIQEGQVYTEETWAEWCKMGVAPAIPGSLTFIRRCEELGIRVYYISNRDIAYLESTLQNMRNLGLEAQPDNVLLKEDDSDKTVRRRSVLEHFEVLLYIGDNLRDYNEIFDQRDNNYGKNTVDDEFNNMKNKFILLPNPMYGTWQKALYNNKSNLTNEEKIQEKKKEAQPIDR